MAQINGWLSIDKTSGSGNDSVTLTAPPYDVGETRTLRLNVKGRFNTKYVNVKQYSTEFLNRYLWIILEEDGVISGFNGGGDLEYSFDQQTWKSVSSSINAPANTYVWLRNNVETLQYGQSVYGINLIRFSVRGNIGGNLSSMGSMMEMNFDSLFNGNTNLIDASKLILPWGELAKRCFRYFFSGCTSLIAPPELPATILADYCYKCMFRDCTSLKTAPELPATTLANSCYNSMFVNCTSLKTAPELPATTLVEDCYYYMFVNCTSLKTAPELPATTLVRSCYRQMFSYCISLETAPELPATTLANYCYKWMFSDCTSLKTAPELPATTLVYNCYGQMFEGCSSLNYIKMLATDITATECLDGWVNGVAETGVFVKHPDAILKDGNSGIPIGWSVETATS